MNDRLIEPDQAISEDEIPEAELELLINAETAVREIFSRGEPKKMPSRAQADSIWRAIAAGVLSDASAAKWARWVAKDVVANVIEDTSDQHCRPERALKALKISGKGAKKIDQELETATIFLRLSNSLSKLKLGPTIFGWMDPPPYVSPYKFAKSLHAEGRFKEYTLKALTGKIERLIK